MFLQLIISILWIDILLDILPDVKPITFLLTLTSIIGLVSIGMQFRQRFLSKLDISAPSFKEQMMSQTIVEMSEEKDWLIKELHHRVKNNLQMMVSLLNTQSMYLRDQESIQAITKSRHRLFAMALVHQKLYQNNDLSSIDFAQYLQEIVDYLKDEYEAPSFVAFEVDAVALQLNVNVAIPLGLIINEAVSNALKYAFPVQKNGKILITLKKQDPECYILEIRDNGVGIDNLENQPIDQTLGKSLMSGLSRQLQGKLNIFNQNGILIRMEFSPAGIANCL